MTLINDLQWGRILALAWLESEFKDRFEINPLTAFAWLITNESVLQGKYHPSIVQNLGIKNPNISLSNIEGMSWPTVDFSALSGGDLDACIQGTVGSINADGTSLWFRGSESEQALKSAPPAPGAATLTSKAWVQIYARIWMDHRLDDLEQQWKTKYGPGKQGYVDEFEKDPVAAITRIVAEIKDKGWKTPIAYGPGTRLWAVQDPTVGGLNPGNPPTIKPLVMPAATPPIVWDFNKCL